MYRVALSTRGKGILSETFAVRISAEDYILEIAETELQGAEAEIDRAEVRYRRGDLSAEAYHNVLETSYRRRDRAQTTIDGVLLRLREEIA